MTKTYKELRNNIIKAFNEKKYTMHNDSYGHGNNKFVDGIQEIGVLTYVEYNEKRSEDVILDLSVKGCFLTGLDPLKVKDSFLAIFSLVQRSNESLQNNLEKLTGKMSQEFAS